jgi:hypothetical protein
MSALQRGWVHAVELDCACGARPFIALGLLIEDQRKGNLRYSPTPTRHVPASTTVLQRDTINADADTPMNLHYRCSDEKISERALLKSLAYLDELEAHPQLTPRRHHLALQRLD